MNKNVFRLDRTAIDKEIERLKRMVSLGGYSPLPDHRIPLAAILKRAVLLRANAQSYAGHVRLKKDNSAKR